MGRPKSQDLRDLAIHHHRDGKSNKAIFDILGGKVSSRSIRCWIHDFSENGKTRSQKSTGRRRTASTRPMKKKVKRLLKIFSGRMVCKLAGISRGSLWKILKEEKIHPYVKRKTPALTPDQIQKRLNFARWWRKNNKKIFKNKPIMFSDEKLFTIDGGLNRQNCRVYANSREQADKNGGFHQLSKYPMSIMVWGGLTKKGSTSPFFIPKDRTVNQEFYCGQILPFAKRQGDILFGTTRWVFQQDGATAHTANRSQNWCSTNFDSFLEKNHWPPNSPDLNPLDYFFWNQVVTTMKVDRSMTLDEFKAEIERAWTAIPVDKIKRAVSRFTNRVRRVENLKGERYLYKK